MLIFCFCFKFSLFLLFSVFLSLTTFGLTLYLLAPSYIFQYCFALALLLLLLLLWLLLLLLLLLLFCKKKVTKESQTEYINNDTNSSLIYFRFLNTPIHTIFTSDDPEFIWVADLRPPQVQPTVAPIVTSAPQAPNRKYRVGRYYVRASVRVFVAKLIECV